MGEFTKDGVAEIEVAGTGEINLSEIVDDPDVRYVFCMSGKNSENFSLREITNFGSRRLPSWKENTLLTYFVLTRRRYFGIRNFSKGSSSMMKLVSKISKRSGKRLTLLSSTEPEGAL